MRIIEQLQGEWAYLQTYKKRAIAFSTTARSAAHFQVLPRRYASGTAIACFIVNNDDALKEAIAFFDDKVTKVFVDVEEKQSFNLFETAKRYVQSAQLVSYKPNDVTLESCDLLIRHQLQDDLVNKRMLVIGTGNLASKLALRLAERQGNVFLEGRSPSKVSTIVAGLNAFLPRYTRPIQPYKVGVGEEEAVDSFDVVVSFLSGQYWAEDSLQAHLTESSFVIDGGIRNFSQTFIEQMLEREIDIVRLDVRFALAYQFLDSSEEAVQFRNEIFGRTFVDGHCLVSGGFVGQAGDVIVDQIVRPTQIIGIADGCGGVKQEDILTEQEHTIIQQLNEAYLS